MPSHPEQTYFENDAIYQVFLQHLLRHLSYEELINFRRTCKSFNQLYLEFANTAEHVKRLVFAELHAHLFRNKDKFQQKYHKNIEIMVANHPAEFITQLQQLFSQEDNGQLSVDHEHLYYLIKYFFKLNPNSENIARFYPNFKVENTHNYTNQFKTAHELSALFNRLSPTEMQIFLNWVKTIVMPENFKYYQQIMKQLIERAKKHDGTRPSQSIGRNLSPALEPESLSLAALRQQRYRPDHHLFKFLSCQEINLYCVYGFCAAFIVIITVISDKPLDLKFRIGLPLGILFLVLLIFFLKHGCIDPCKKARQSFQVTQRHRRWLENTEDTPLLPR